MLIMTRRLLVIPAVLGVLAGLAGPAGGQGGDVGVALDQFGLNSIYRPGEMVGIRLELSVPTDSPLEEATGVWVQWEVPNADGDIAEYGQPRTLTKGRPSQVWLYAPLPPEAAGSVWSVRVYEFRDGRRGRELGGLRISPPAPGFSDEELMMTSFIGVVGDNQMGLNQYTFGMVNMRNVVTAHENTRVVFGLRPEDLPDRWEGLMLLEALAWAGELPQDLSAAQAEAIREWVRRGGHFIISLPEDTNPWGLGDVGKTDLQDLLPPAPRKDEDVALSELLPVLCKAEGLTDRRADFRMSLRVFKDLRGEFDAMGNQYEPLIALPDGRVVAVQRLFGHGWLTVIGIDLSNRQFTSRPLSNGMLGTLPQADVLWNRILGRRGDTPTGRELTRITEEDRLSLNPPNMAAVGRGELFSSQIGMSATAGAGLGMALLLFAAYWVVAGPGGFAVLKRYKRVKHAWVAFAATAGVFTAMAWGGVTLLRSGEITVRHVTYLDHIVRTDPAWGLNDPQYQRAVGWLSMYLPGYGDTTVGVASLPADGAVPAMRDLLLSWTNPDLGKASPTFQNVDRYAVDISRDPDDFALPTRSTATELKAYWLGGLDPEWGGLLRESPDDPIRVVKEAGRELLRGSIISDLPGTLRDTTLIWIRSRRSSDRRYARDASGREAQWVEYLQSGQILNRGCWIGLGRIEPGAGNAVSVRVDNPEHRDLSLSRNINAEYVQPLRSGSLIPGGQALDFARSRSYMEMLGLFGQLTPPPYLKRPERSGEDRVQFSRVEGRELDLSAWFTRPCVLVMGFLDNSACPIPLRVDGRGVKSEGLTVVRWIRPLPLDEEIAFPREEEQETGGVGSAAP